MMHTTATIDYIVLLSGEISLLLDEGEPIKLKPFDAVVQRATNHSWVNTGHEPALLMCVMVGTRRRHIGRVCNERQQHPRCRRAFSVRPPAAVGL
jgi:uncharacterized cupin superfamily protein